MSFPASGIETLYRNNIENVLLIMSILSFSIYSFIEPGNEQAGYHTLPNSLSRSIKGIKAD